MKPRVLTVLVVGALLAAGCNSPPAATSHSFTLGGTVTGLQGTGLTLQDNGVADVNDATATVPVTKDGPFTFPFQVAEGANYSVTVLSQPSSPTQVCTITSGSGTVGTANITNIAVTCTDQTYAVGGTVTGLLGSGLVLEDDGGDDLAVAGSGSFMFATPVASGATYAVTVKTQPVMPAQTCTVVTHGTGTVGSGPITGVIVTCTTDALTIGGTITGLTGTGLVLQDTGGDDLAVSPDATTFTFATPLMSGATYSVTVATQPNGPSQSCVVANGTGTVTAAPVTSVAITCTTNAFAVGGVVVGLMGSGLVLQDNSGDTLPVAGSGAFTFVTPVTSGTQFSVTVLTQPSAPAQTCAVTGAMGTVLSGPVTTVTVSCGTNAYTISGATTGLMGTGLVLSLNGGPGLAVESSGQFSFPETLPDLASYAVTILAQPTNPSQTCTLSGAVGTVAAANVTSIQVACSANTYPVTVNVTGLMGSGLVLEDNGSDVLPVPSSGTYTFPTLVASGADYSVTVSQEPTRPGQTCAVTNGSGVVGSAAVSNISIVCATAKFTIGGTVTGLEGTVILQDNGSDTLIVSAGEALDGGSTVDGGIPFTFAAPVASGSPYSASVSQQPSMPSQTCVVSHDPLGIVGSAPITDVGVSCSTNAFQVDVTVVGLQGMGLVLGDNVGDTVPVASNGVVVMPTQQLSSTDYTITVLSQPTAPAQTCHVLGGTGVVGSSTVTGVTVNCATNEYTVGGTVTGLTGTGLVLADNVGDSLPVSGNGSFSFPALYDSGAHYAVTVQTQPHGPSQTCTVSGSTGSVGTADVTSVTVNCATAAYTVSVNVSGLSGSGLGLADNGSDMLSVTGNGVATFATSVLSGSTYAVTVVSQPTSPWQTCTATSGSGTVAAANVTVAVTCTTNQYAVSVSVSGLTGTGLTLSDNGGPGLPVTANGLVTFPALVASGSPYEVTVVTQPSNPSQSCQPTGGIGITGGAAALVQVICANDSFTVGGTVTGLASGESVQLTNGGDLISVSASGAFTFDVPVASGSTYAVTVSQQPGAPIAQTCAVIGATGTVGAGPVTSVAVSCAANTYAVGGTISGYAGTGLVLQDNGGDNVTIPAGATSFAFPTPLASGASYSVAVLTEPTGPWQTCTVSSATGIVPAGSVTSVAVTCTTNTYPVGGFVTGLVAGDALVLQNNTASNTVTVSANGSFQFPALPSGAAYAVTVQKQPSSPAQTCTVPNGTGVVAGVAVTSIAISCTTGTYTVGGAVVGYSGTGLQLQLNGGSTLTVGVGATSFTFGVSVMSGASYAVSVLTQPSGPSETCTITNGSGTVGSSNVTSIVVTCTAASFTVGGTVTGLSGTGLVLQNGSDTIAISGNGAFTFDTPVASGSPYDVLVATPPSGPSQTCAIASGLGTVGGGPVTNVVVTCTTSAFTIGGTISGLTGSGLVLVLNGENSLSVASGSTSFAFSTPVASGSSYAVTVGVVPSSPTQTCAITNGSGTVGAAPVTNVAIGCTTNGYTVSVAVGGLSGTLVLADNGSDSLTFMANGTQTFPKQILSGGKYNVTVTAQPAGQTCAIVNATGTIGGSNVTNVAVACASGAFTISATVSGMSGGTLVLQNNGGDNLTVTSNGVATFSAAEGTGATYDVTVLSQPLGQGCSVGSASGTVGTSDVTNVTVTCAAGFTVTFTTCAASGAFGPTQAQCNTAYSSNSYLSGAVSVGLTGIQSWTVPDTGSYQITAFGAQGASGQGGTIVGGLGAEIQGTFALTAGTVVQIVVGQAGSGQGSATNGGGGGGSFVVAGSMPLVIAGGGGGTRLAAAVNGFPGLTSTAAGNGYASQFGTAGNGTCAGGTGGSGGSVCESWGSGGGGFEGNGGSDLYGGSGGSSFAAGAAGGTGSPDCGAGVAANGGFGGGGSGVGCYGGGGGGGYSGGGGGWVAGGGGSINNGTSQTNTSGVQSGNGSVVIQLL